LIVDDFGLRRLSAQQSQDLYELIIERHRHSSFIVTSNGNVDEYVDEWLGLLDDPILGNSALDRLAHSAYQVLIEGPSYRARLPLPGLARSATGYSDEACKPRSPWRANQQAGKSGRARSPATL